MVKRKIDLSRFIGEHATLDGDVPAPEPPEGAAGVGGIRVGRGDDHPRDAGLDDGVCAGRRAAAGRARLERDVKRGPLRPVAPALGIGDGLDLRMRQTGPAMPAAPDDFSALGHHSADERVGRSLALGPLGQAQCLPHQLFIAWHFGAIADGSVGGGSGIEDQPFPAVAGLLVEQPLVQAVVAVKPKLNFIRVEPPAGPIRRTGHFAAFGMLGLQLR